MRLVFRYFYSIVFFSWSQSLVAQDSSISRIKGLIAKVEVLRDTWGVNHIYAGNQHDLFFAQGYCAAKDRLFQFEIWRRQAKGTLAEIFGQQEVQRDIGARLFAFRGDVNEEFSHYHKDGKEIILAFTEGVNAFISHTLDHPEQLPDEFRLLNILPGKWTPAIVISRHQGIMGNLAEELNIGRAVTKVGVSEVKKYLWLHPGDPLIQLDSSIRDNLLTRGILGLYSAWRKEIIFDSSAIVATERAAGISIQPHGTPDLYADHPSVAELQGSNNWTVSGSRTEGGRPLLASDPHRKIAVPSLRYIVHLSAPGWNVMGAGEPQVPGVAIGHNENGAWGITVHQTDIEDLYVYDLNPKQLNQYRYKGTWRSMKEVKDSIEVKERPSQKIILRYTIHGPVLFIDSVNYKAYALKSTWLEAGAAPYLSSLRIDQAYDWMSFRKACSYSYLPSLNMIWADTRGKIGWQVVGKIPIRKNFSGLVPVPGDGRYEWGPYLPVLQRPFISGPAKGFIATANENNIPGDFKYLDATGFMWPDAFRARRIYEVLSSDTRMNMQKMSALQTDYFSYPAKELVPMLQQISFDDTISQQAKKQITAWDFFMKKSSIGAAIYNKWEIELMLQAHDQFIPAAIKGLFFLQTTRVIEWLQHPDLKFGGDAARGRDDFLKTTFITTVNKLKLQLGNDITHWQFGEDKYKHIQFIHPLSGLLNDRWKQKLNTTSIPRGGYGHTIGSTGDSDNQASGASFRYITDTGNWDATLMINTPGQSGDPSSRWYKNLFEIWANDEYFPGYFTRDRIRKNTAEVTSMIPANGVGKPK